MEFDPLPESSAPAPPRRAQERRDLIEQRLRRWGIPLGASALLGALLGIGVAAAIHMPRVDSLSEYTPGLITQMYDRNGQVFSTFARQRRMMLQEGDVPKVLQNAIISAEDSSFFKHGGIDAVGIVRAALANLRSGRKAEGASTITMQLARELFLTKDKRWSRKIEEAFLAVELEKKLSKQQILTLYCNLVFFGHGNYGVEVAARDYFNKSVKELTIPEAATLAGIVQLPSRYSPYRSPDLVTKRRNYVLRRMLDQGFLSRGEYEAAVATPLLVVRQRPKSELGSFFAEEVRQHLETTYGVAALYDQGLDVHTTLDVAIQRAAEEAVHHGLLKLDHRKGWRGPIQHLDTPGLEDQTLPSWADWTGAPDAWVEGLILAADAVTAQVKIAEKSYTLTRQGVEWTGRHRPNDLLKRGDVAWFRLALPEKGGDPYLALEQEPQLEGAALVIESATGAVRAMVGGWSFERTKFNRTLQAKRQVGSAFKPFVYGAALEAGFTPADALFDGPAVFLGADGLLSYSPRNYYRKYYGILTLRRALEQSVNVTTIKLLSLIGVERVIDFAHRCGIEEQLPPYPSLGLGSADVTPIQMASAYATFANQGVYVEPYWVESVSTHDGRPLENHLARAHRAMDPQVAYVLTHMLEGVIARGTGSPANDLGIDIAGKTGTTDDYSDAWFIGYTPRYTVLTWVGYDRKRSIGKNMTGAEAALPTWKMILARGLKEGWIDKTAHFSAPPGVVTEEIDFETGLVAAPGAPRVIAETFIAGTEPTTPWEPKWTGIMSLPWFQQRPFYIPRQGESMPDRIADWSVIEEQWKEKEKEHEKEKP